MKAWGLGAALPKNGRQAADAAIWPVARAEKQLPMHEAAKSSGVLQEARLIACWYEAAGTDARRMKMKYATSRKAVGRWHFRNGQLGGLGIRCQSDTKIFLKQLGFPVFQKLWRMAFNVG